jgi:DNA-binding MarR family transcriptional regulator
MEYMYMPKDSPTAAECLEMGRTCACYNLRRAARAVTQIFDAELDAVGLRATQFTLLSILSYPQEEPLTVTSLADAVVLEQSSLSRNLAVLERRGWIRLAPGADRRERIPTLTREGRNALARAYPAWKRAQARIASALPANELDAQLRSLKRMAGVAQAMRTEKPRGRGAARDDA